MTEMSLGGDFGIFENGCG